MSDVERTIRNELDGPSIISGHRRMWYTFRVKYGLYITRAEVASLLRRLDIAGVAERKKAQVEEKKVQLTWTKLLLACGWE